MPPSSLNALLKNVPVLSEASWNKPVDRVLLGASYEWWFLSFNAMLRIACPIRWTRDVTKFCSYFVEHRETSELGSGIIPARPSCPFHLLVVSLSVSKQQD